jgi:hypothetical protein
VQDARQSVYILDELAKVSRSDKQPTGEDVIAFAELISELKNMRYFDARLQRIYELQVVDSFLQANHLIDTNDVQYFSTLVDFWDFGNRPLRESGNRFSIHFTPGYNMLSSIYDDENQMNGESFINNKNYFTNLLLISTGFDFIHEKPINLSWQHSIKVTGNYGLAAGKEENKINNITEDVNLPHVHLSYSQGAGFYPNTRTELRLSYQLAYTQLLDTDKSTSEFVDFGNKAFESGARFNFYCYLSPQLRLSLNSSLRYIWQNQNYPEPSPDDWGGVFPSSPTAYNPFGLNIYNNRYEKRFWGSFSIGFAYSIF